MEKKEKEDVKAVEVKLNLFQRLSAISKSIGTIPKEGHNSFSNYDYVRAADVVNKVREACTENGVFILPSCEEVSRETYQTDKQKTAEIVHLKMKFTLVNVDNPEEKEVVVLPGYASDTGDKAIWKGYTGIYKYFLTQTFQIGTEDDPENEKEPVQTGRSSSPAPVQRASTPPQQPASAPRPPAQGQRSIFETKPCNKCHRPIIWMKDNKGKNACFEPESIDARRFTEDQFWLAGEGAGWVKGPRQSGQGFIRHPMNCTEAAPPAPVRQASTAPQQEEGPPPIDDDDIPF
jgi:hypothetical protein